MARKTNDHKPCPSLDTLNSLFEYDAKEGRLRWLVPRGRKKAGDIAGYLNPVTLYRTIGINGEYYREHRLIWFMCTGTDPGELTVDHINEVKDDNHIENLRLATYNQQASYKTGALGFMQTVSEYSGELIRTWRAYIKIKGKNIHLGTFNCPLLARLAFENAYKDEHGVYPRMKPT